MFNPIQNASIFLIKTLFDLYIILIITRFILQVFRGDFYNLISQFIIKATNPALNPFRRIIPGLFGIDMAAIVLMILLKSVEIILIKLIATGTFFVISAPSIFGLFIVVIAELLDQAIGIFTFGIIFYAILSWFSQATYNPAMIFLHSLCYPVLKTIRKYIPLHFGGLDLSPLVALILLQLANFLIIDSILYYSRFLSQVA